MRILKDLVRILNLQEPRMTNSCLYFIANMYLKNSIRYSWFDRKDAYLGGHAPNGPTLTQADPFICASNFATYVLVTILTISIDISDNIELPWLACGPF